MVHALAGIGGKRLDVAPLAFGVDSGKGQGRLAGAAQPGNHGQRIARDFDVDIFKVVLAGAAHGDLVDSHGFGDLSQPASSVEPSPTEAFGEVSTHSTPYISCHYRSRSIATKV